MTDASPTPQPARSRVRRWLFIGSLALNLFLIAFLAIGAAKHRWRDDISHPRPMWEMARYMSSEGENWHFLHHMEDEDLAVLQSLKNVHGDALREAMLENRIARIALLNLVQAGERNLNILEPAFSRARAAQIAFQDAFEALLIDASQQLSDEGYTHLAGWRHRYRHRN